LGAGGPFTGAPELFLRRSLLFSVASIGCPPGLAPEDWAPLEFDRNGGLGAVDETVGLKVTVR
jgi:hypothetical protein